MKNEGYEVIWIGRNDLIPAHQSKEMYCDQYYDGKHLYDTKNFKSENKPSKHPKSDPLKNDKTYDEIGYYSHFIGKIDDEKAHKPMKTGNDWICIESALKYIDEYSKRKSEKPFFLYITLTFPHPPYMCEEPWFSSIDRQLCKKRLPSALNLDKPSMLKEICRKQNLRDWGDENFIEVRATYLAMVSRFDYQFGLIKQKLKEKNLYDESSIFVFSDHGDYTGDYDVVEKAQNCFEDCITKVPLIMKPASTFQYKAGIKDDLVELVDLVATIEDMACIKTDYIHFGESLLPLINEGLRQKKCAFCEGGRIHGEYWAMEKGHSRDSEYWPRLSTQCSENGEHTKAVMIRMGNLKYVYRLYEKDELYDLDLDPNELNNLIEDSKYEKQCIEMKNQMLTWFLKTGDIVPNRKDPRY